MGEELTMQSVFHRVISLEYPKFIVIRLNSGAIRTARGFIQLAPKGTPDTMVVCDNGIVLFFEAKSEKGKLNEDQEKMHQRLRSLGQKVIEYRSVQEGMAAIKFYCN
jgi:hypothetical protein